LSIWLERQQQCHRSTRIGALRQKDNYDSFCLKKLAEAAARSADLRYQCVALNEFIARKAMALGLPVLDSS
jgi:hypothetical protein